MVLETEDESTRERPFGQSIFAFKAGKEWLDGEHVIFGELIEGKQVVLDIERCATQSGDPSQEHLGESVDMTFQRELRVAGVGSVSDSMQGCNTTRIRIVGGGEL